MTMATPAPSPTTLAVCEKPYIREKITHTALDIRPRIEQPQNQRSVFSAFPIPRPMEGVVADRGGRSRGCCYATWVEQSQSYST
jgi:hypothetical protein